MEASVNQHMKNPPIAVGIVNPPNKFYKPVLYSDSVASYQFKQLQQDIYQSGKKSKKLNEKKTPKSVFVALGLGALALAFPLIKKALRH